MRRSKSNPAKYTRNYRSISQRRMTTDKTNADKDECNEIQRLRKVVKHGAKMILESSVQQIEEDTTKHAHKASGSKRKRTALVEPLIGEEELYGGILSKDLLKDQLQGTEYNNNNKDANPLVVVARERKKIQHQPPQKIELNPHELKQAKQLYKSATRKLKQLEQRADQKEKRQTLYRSLQKTALPPAAYRLLKSSATLGKKVSTKQALSHILQRERAGLTITPDEHDLLYKDRSGCRGEPAVGDAAVTPFAVVAEADDSNMVATRVIRTSAGVDDGLGTPPASAKALTKKECQQVQEQDEAEQCKTIKNGEDKKSVAVEPTTESKPALSIAAQMMASLSKLKTVSNELAETTLKEQEDAKRKTLQEESKVEPIQRRYVPTDPVVLKTAAALNMDSSYQPRRVANKAALNSNNNRVREVQRPVSVATIRFDLPVATMEFEVMDAIRNHDVTIICAETGSGKSTQVPQFLYEAGLSTTTTTGDNGDDIACMIGVTQPRRVAAVSTAKRVCYELGQGNGRSIQNNGSKKEGNLVAYQTRYEVAGLGSKTHIKFMTDGILLQEIQSDLLLRKYSVVVLDEAHERGLNSDVLIGLLSAALPLRKEAAMEDGSSSLPPLKLIIMSATLRVEDFTGNNKSLFPLSPPAIVRVPGRTHPVTIHHSKVTELDNYGRWNVCTAIVTTNVLVKRLTLLSCI
jgi:hypothetical protein